MNKNGLAEDCFATEQGWVLRHYKGADKNTARYWDELAGSNRRSCWWYFCMNLFGEADVTAVFFEHLRLSQGDTRTVVVIYNEQVDVTACTFLQLLVL